MEIIFLPGLHGSGELFGPLVSNLSIPYQIIELSNGEDQSQKQLASEVSKQLPNNGSILVAESFSGCLVPEILGLCPEKVAGIIFVASFVSSPGKLLLMLSRALPAWILHNSTLLRLVLKVFFLNGNSDQKLLEQCVQVVRAIPVSILKKRLDTLYRLEKPLQQHTAPTVYLQAGGDRVVGSMHCDLIKTLYSASKVTLNGPHFLLQTNPEECVKAIEKSVKKIQALSQTSPIQHSAE